MPSPYASSLDVSEDSMKASRVRRFGPPEVISFEDIDRPEPSDQEVVVRANAALPHAEARRAHEMLDGLTARPPGKIALSVSS